MRYLTLLFTSLFLNFIANAQVAINTTGALPRASSILDVTSTSKGVLFPQVSIDSLKDVNSIPSPANGLVVYNTTQPGLANDMARGYYWYSTNAVSWVRFADNLTDNVWKNGGLLGIQLRDKTDGVEIMDNFTGSASNWTPKVKILKMVDSALLNSKNNITTLVLSAVERKTTAGWEFRQKNSIIFENAYLLDNLTTSATSTVGISSYTENAGTTANNLTNGLGFYTFATPVNTATSDTPSMSLYRHNVCIGDYALDTNSVTAGRLQIKGFSNGDQLSLRHPNSTVLKWGLYVSAMDSSLNFYSNGSLRSNIDRVTGVFSALSDRTKKKNILPMKSVLASVLQLKGYSYNYLDSKDTDRRMLGFMAQDVQPFFPELVYQRYDREITKPVLTMDYSGFGVIAIKAIQEQQKQIDDVKKESMYVKKENMDLKLQIEALIKRMEALEKK